MERRLLLKLMQNPGLMPAGSDAEAFYNARVGTVMYQLALVEKDWQTAMLPSPASQTTTDSLQNDIFDLLEQLATIDANTPPPTQFEETLDSLQTGVRAGTIVQLSNVRNLLDATLSAVYAQRSANLAPVQSTLAGINTSTVYETNRKQLFELLMDWGSGQQPDSLDLAFVRNLAAQCASQGGDAVDFARTLLPVCEQGQYLSEDPAEPCNRSSLEVNAEEHPRSVVHPNPTDAVLHIEFPAPVSGSLRLQSLEGRTLKTWQVHQQRQIALQLHKLPPGIYLLHLPAANGSSEVHKVIVQR